MVLQFRPEGQHNTDAALLNGKQTEPDGQQNVDGSPGSVQGRWFGMAHESDALGKRLTALVEPVAAAHAEETRHTAVSFRSVAVHIKKVDIVDGNATEVERGQCN